MVMRPFFYSLAFKISISILLIEAAVLMTLGYYYINRFSHEIDQRILSQAQIPGKLMAQRVLNYDVVRDEKALERLTGLAVKKALVIRSDGMIFYGKDMTVEDQLLTNIMGKEFAKVVMTAKSTVLVNRNLETASVLSVITPLYNKKNMIGHLYMEVDTSIATQQKKEVLVFFVFTSLLGIFLTTLAEVLVVHYLTTPRIRKTIQCLQQVEAGNLSKLVSRADSKDEFGVLQRSVNSMITQLKQRTAERAQAEKELIRHRDHLEEEIAARTASLQGANKELEAYSYSISHDLRAPLRLIDGFSQAVLEDYNDKLDESGQHYLNRIRFNTLKMNGLINDILDLSRVSRRQLNHGLVNLSELAKQISNDLRQQYQDSHIEVEIESGVTANGDSKLLKIALENLLANAWKFTKKSNPAIISFGSQACNKNKTYFVRDNGVGFDMRYVDRLFNPFQRLHSDDDFEGTGIGLATVQRIIHRHGGKIWAESEIGRGSAFYFNLP